MLSEMGLEITPERGENRVTHAVVHYLAPKWSFKARSTSWMLIQKILLLTGDEQQLSIFPEKQNRQTNHDFEEKLRCEGTSTRFFSFKIFLLKSGSRLLDLEKKSRIRLGITEKLNRFNSRGPVRFRITTENFGSQNEYSLFLKKALRKQFLVYHFISVIPKAFRYLRQPQSLLDRFQADGKLQICNAEYLNIILFGIRQTWNPEFKRIHFNLDDHFWHFSHVVKIFQSISESADFKIFQSRF